MKGKKKFLLNNTRLQYRVVETSVSSRMEWSWEAAAVVLRHKIFNYSINIHSERENPERYQVDFDCEISKCGLRCGAVGKFNSGARKTSEKEIVDVSGKGVT